MESEKSAGQKYRKTTARSTNRCVRGVRIQAQGSLAPSCLYQQGVRSTAIKITSTSKPIDKIELRLPTRETYQTVAERALSNGLTCPKSAAQKSNVEVSCPERSAGAPKGWKAILVI